MNVHDVLEILPDRIKLSTYKMSCVRTKCLIIDLHLHFARLQVEKKSLDPSFTHFFFFCSVVIRVEV